MFSTFYRVLHDLLPHVGDSRRVLFSSFVLLRFCVVLVRLW